MDKLAAHPEHLSAPFGCGCCFRNVRTSNRSKANAVLMQCQVFALQFVMFKPILAVLNFGVNHLGWWGGGLLDNKMDWRNPQMYILIFTNLSVSMAFFGLLKFYHAVCDDLQWCRPWPKFLCIKGVVFATFWQGLAINVLARSGGGGAGDISTWQR